jgi:prepilin-type processing-associated H-X9-DG protein
MIPSRAARLSAALLIVTMLRAPALATPRSVVSVITHQREHAGQCFATRVKSVGFRLQDAFTGKPNVGSGSAVVFADGHVNVSYDQLPAVDTSRQGDPVRLCVRAVPTDCPARYDAGIVYRAKNLRSGQSWELSDTIHACDGA